MRFISGINRISDLGIWMAYERSSVGTTANNPVKRFKVE